MSDTKLEVLDFYADWCGPCHTMKPIINELTETYKGKVAFTEIDVDANPGQAQQFQVMSIPTFIFRKNGTVVDQIVGAVPKAEFEKKIEEHLG